MSLLKSSDLINLHTHTLFSDGGFEPEKYVLEALRLGQSGVGFSDHGPMAVPNRGHDRFSCAMSDDNLSSYISEINRLKIKYDEKIKVFLGIEEDFFPPADRALFDYTIGSVHYLSAPNSDELFAIDYIPDETEKLISAFGGGLSGAKQMVESYYDRVAFVGANHNPDILGHLDLITKLNKNNRYFDMESDWYKEVVFNTLDELKSKSSSIIELNSGGITRRYKSVPYPARFILERIRELNLPVTISSDAHLPDHLDFYFDEMIELVREVGFKSIKQFDGTHFVDFPLY